MKKILSVAALMALVFPSMGADGTYTNVASGGNWSDSANWSGGSVADGSGFTANFNTLDLTEDNLVHMDTARIIGNLVFGDTIPDVSGSRRHWTLDNNGNAANVLTLAGTTPTITVNQLGALSGSNQRWATISAEIAGTSGLTKDGVGMLVLTGANTYTGTTAIDEGELKLQGDAFSGTARDYSIAAGAVLNLDGNNTWATGTSTINGTGTLRLTGGLLGAASNGRKVNMELGSDALIDIQSGAELRNGGWSGINWDNNLADMNVDGTLDIWDGTAVKVDALTGSGTITHTSYGVSTDLHVGVDGGSGTFDGTITEQASNRKVNFIKEGAGTQTLTGANTYSGGTTVSGGTLALSGGGSLSDTTAVNVGASGASFDISGITAAGETIGSLAGASGSSVVLGAKNLTVGGTGASSTFTGGIGGTGGLTVTGTNTLTLNGGANTYEGGTTINDGATVRIRHNDALGSGDITIDGGTLAPLSKTVSLFSRNITVGAGGATMYASGGYLSLRDSTIFNGAGTLTIADGNGQKVYMDSDNSATFTGDVHLNGASALLSIKSDSIALDSGTANLILEDGGRLEANNADLNLTGRNLQLNGTGGTIHTGNRPMTMTGSTLSGSGELNLIGGTTLITTKDNTLSGAVTLDGIHVGLGASKDNGADVLGTGDVTLNNGARLKNNDNVQTLNNNLVIGSGGGRMMAGWGKNVTVEGAVSGSGTLTIDGDSGFIVLNNANNTFNGDIAFTNSFGYGGGKLRLESLAGGGSYDGTISGIDAGANLELTGEILLGGDNTFVGLTEVLAGGAIGGNGSLDGDLTLHAGAGFVFDGDDIGLSVAGTVTLDSTFGIDDLLGISSATADGTYTLIDETATVFTSGFENIGSGNAYDLGDGKSAYFQDGSLQVVVIPEPATLSLIAAFGVAVLFVRRRFKI
ncbi:Adhesin BmaC autotransporter [Pontiella desulfatans]|uniref:Adhesin BmaC autotransporter n=1 Tax=Pontiella desulfatans TaxID=2750659 RepID=A0A6C2UBJ0_PONDE|nr:autotransporter-associated beta strand repeat-containing protein [Pontiella desulfatans]VGO16997.1 Adhesin BmaC autotransporter [Pontiella desulfatans]